MLSAIELREKNLDGGLTIVIRKLLKCNLAQKKIITTCSGFHLQSHPRNDSVAVPTQPEWTRE